MFILNIITVWAVGALLGFGLAASGMPAGWVFLLSALGGASMAAYQIYRGGR